MSENGEHFAPEGRYCSRESRSRPRYKALRARCRLSPTALRKDAGARAKPHGLTFQLCYRPPFDCDTLTTFLGLRVVDGVEDVQDGVPANCPHDAS